MKEGSKFTGVYRTSRNERDILLHLWAYGAYGWIWVTVSACVIIAALALVNDDLIRYSNGLYQLTPKGIAQAKAEAAL